MYINFCMKSEIFICTEIKKIFLIQLKLEIPILVQIETEIFDFKIKNFDN